MSDIKLTAESRTISGKGASRRLRKTGTVPAIIYGNNFEAVSIQATQRDINNLLNEQGILSKIINIEVGTKKYDTLLKSVQKHPYKPVVMHVDFLNVDENEMVVVNVPIEYLNESKCFGVKNQGAMITHFMNEVELKAKAKAIPEKIEVDMENLKLGETIHLKDLKVPKGVIIVELLKGLEHDLPVAKVAAPDESSYDTPELVETESTKVSKDAPVAKADDKKKK